MRPPHFRPKMLRSLPTDRDRLDLQDWVIDRLTEEYGAAQTAEIGAVLRHRAPITLRVNVQKTTRAQLQAELAKAEIETSPNPASDTALTILSNPRRAVLQPCFQQGWFELQDAASQAVADAIVLNGRILDYCAGGGGKSLALAARSGLKIFAHDISAARMSEIAPRASRGGHDIEVISPQIWHQRQNLTRWCAIYPVLAAAPGADLRKVNGA